MSKVKRRRKATEVDRRWTSPIPPAPGDLRIIQAFVSTVDKEKGTDTLSSPQALSNWLQTWQILAPGTELAAADLERARDVRSSLRKLLYVNTGLATVGDAVTQLDQAANSALLRIRFDAGSGHVRFEPAGSGLDEALAHLFCLVREAQINGNWTRLKVCAHKPCRSAFYDASRNRSAKWCTMRRCGNRINARTSRRRYPMSR